MRHTCIFGQGANKILWLFSFSATFEVFLKKKNPRLYKAGFHDRNNPCIIMVWSVWTFKIKFQIQKYTYGPEVTQIRIQYWLRKQ